MRRREFIVGIGAAAAWPLAARAQQGDRILRIGVLMFGDKNDPVWNSPGVNLHRYVSIGSSG